MEHLEALASKLNKFTKLPVIIEPSATYRLNEIRLTPKSFKLGKQFHEELDAGKVCIYYDAVLPVDIILNIKGANNNNSLLLSAMKYSTLIQHFFKITNKLPRITQEIEDFKVDSEAVIIPKNIDGNLQPVLFELTDKPLEEPKKLPGFQNKFEIELIFKVQQILDVPVLKNIERIK
jgi:hypothetical protein